MYKRQEKNRRKLRCILSLLQIQKDSRLKETALACARIAEYGRLKIQAFQILSTFQKDDEIEEFFIEWIVEDRDLHSLLAKIANSYLDGEG